MPIHALNDLSSQYELIVTGNPHSPYSLSPETPPPAYSPHDEGERLADNTAQSMDTENNTHTAEPVPYQVNVPLVYLSHLLLTIRYYLLSRYGTYLPAVLRIRDVYPGSDFFPSRIPDPNCLHPGSSSKNLSILTQNKPKKWFLSSKKYDPGCSSRIRMLTFYPSQIPDPGVKKAPDPGSGSATLPTGTVLLRLPVRTWNWRCWLGPERFLLMGHKHIKCYIWPCIWNVPGMVLSR